MFLLPLIAAISIAAAQQPTQGQAPGQSAAIDAAISHVAPSLVRIHVVSIEYQEGREVKREASGSGTIIRPEGYVLTNHHVAGRTKSIVCTLATREEIPADLVGTDPLSDIAILKLRPATPRCPRPRNGDSSAQGRRRISRSAVHRPLPIGTMGIVSNTEMIMPGMFWPFNRMTLDGEDVGSIVRWIGHDAPIFGGNSGGPLVNMQGDIVGVNEISLGLAGAIPANLAQEVAAALIKEGKVRRSWIGLEVQPLLKASPAKHGALVGGALEGSPAAKAGFASGDILTRLGGRPIDVRFAEEVPPFNQLVMRLPRGQPVDAVVLRNGVEKTLHVTPEDRESVEAPVSELAPIGVTASNLTSWSAKELKRADRSGVRIQRRASRRAGGPGQTGAQSRRRDRGDRREADRRRARCRRRSTA